MGSRNRNEKPKYYSTKKSANQVSHKLCGIIADYGAKHYSVEMDENEDGDSIPKAISFWIETEEFDNEIPVRLEPQTLELKDRMDCDLDHARAVAWKQLKDQVELTLELVHNGIMDFHEAFLPHVQVFGKDGQPKKMSETIVNNLEEDNFPQLPTGE